MLYVYLSLKFSFVLFCFSSVLSLHSCRERKLGSIPFCAAKGMFHNRLSVNNALREQKERTITSSLKSRCTVQMHSEGPVKAMQQRCWFHTLDYKLCLFLKMSLHMHCPLCQIGTPPPLLPHTLVPMTWSSCQDACPQLSDSGFSGFLLTLIKPQ